MGGANDRCALTDGCLFADSSHIPVRSFRLQNVTTLFLSSDSSTLYVGARDAILSLDVSQAEILTQKQEVRHSAVDLPPGSAVVRLTCLLFRSGVMASDGQGDRRLQHERKEPGGKFPLQPNRVNVVQNVIMSPSCLHVGELLSLNSLRKQFQFLRGRSTDIRPSSSPVVDRILPA